MKKNIVVIILSLIVAGLIGFITYDNFFKPSTKCECTTTDISKTTTSKDTSKNNTAKKDTTDTTTTDNSTTTVSKTADDIFKDYVANLSKAVEKEGQSFLLKNIAGEKFNIRLNTNKELKIDFDTREKAGQDMLVANDVISFYVTDVGNGGYNMLHFLTIDGSFYSTTINTSISEGAFTLSKVPYKNIVSAKSYGADGGHSVIYIDIEGNTYSK